MRLATGADGVAWPFVGLFCLLCWVSGVLVGYAVRQLREQRAASRPAKARRKRRSSYYFSEEDTRWGSGRWRRGFAWMSAAAISLALVAAGAVALANYKGRPNAAAGYRN